MTPPLHPSAQRWYKKHHDYHYPKSLDNMPEQKPCDFCGETVHGAYLCDTCALCEVLRLEDMYGKDRTTLLTLASATNSTKVIEEYNSSRGFHKRKK